MAYRRSSGLAGKIVAALLCAAVAGYVWACVETGRTPRDVLNFFAS